MMQSFYNMLFKSFLCAFVCLQFAACLGQSGSGKAGSSKEKTCDGVGSIDISLEDDREKPTQGLGSMQDVFGDLLRSYALPFAAKGCDEEPGSSLCSTAETNELSLDFSPTTPVRGAVRGQYHDGFPACTDVVYEMNVEVGVELGAYLGETLDGQLLVSVKGSGDPSSNEEATRRSATVFAVLASGELQGNVNSDLPDEIEATDVFFALDAQWSVEETSLDPEGIAGLLRWQNGEAEIPEEQLLLGSF